MSWPQSFIKAVDACALGWTELGKELNIHPDALRRYYEAGRTVQRQEYRDSLKEYFDWTEADLPPKGAIKKSAARVDAGENQHLMSSLHPGHENRMRRYERCAELGIAIDYDERDDGRDFSY